MATSSTGILPTLSPGIVSIYGSASIYGFGVGSGLTFGRIYRMSENSSGSYNLGQNVLFHYKDANTISYANTTYYLIEESKILMTEVEPVVILT